MRWNEIKSVDPDSRQIGIVLKGYCLLNFDKILSSG